MAEFDTLRATMPQGGPRFQIGIPGDVDLALFTFGPIGMVRHLRPFTEALATTMHHAYKLFGDDALGCGHIVGNRSCRILHDADVIAVLFQDPIDFFPAGTVNESAVNQNDRSNRGIYANRHDVLL